ncbi:hypothetical protein [Pedobacter agri]|uniref:hypothetical protein n=1 Tax=Pedobacter agri TaxID=454586 RepID=UPI00278B13D8|nr:hypothetical protein [Pedobacter agri]MDQ1141607.1 hypothetical protein [Pedobacter agri]
MKKLDGLYNIERIFMRLQFPSLVGVPAGRGGFDVSNNIDVTTVSVTAKSIFHRLKQSHLLYYLLKEIASPKCRGRLYLAMTSAINNALWEFLSPYTNRLF